MKLILKVNINDECADNFQYLEVELSLEQLKWLQEKAKFIKENDIDRVSAFGWYGDTRAVDYDTESTDGFVVLVDPDYGRTELDAINVSEHSFWWSGYLKHSEITWETSRVYFANLDVEVGRDERETV